MAQQGLAAADHKDDDSNLHATQADSYTGQIQAGNLAPTLTRFTWTTTSWKTKPLATVFPMARLHC
ncbi:MAG: hypothetical protein IPP17_30740 [Bacteroidetes bacterium]|nr:hypothetical protein [Bacteroidota bacterium]